MDLGIKGRVAIVTASSRGLGRASAEALAAEGVSLTVNGRGEESLDATVRHLEDAGAAVLPVAGDMADPELPARLVAATIERFGRVDIVVANAGGPPPGRALDVDDDAIRSAVETNLLASVRLIRASLPLMQAQAWGRVCCITSYSVVQPIPALALSNVARVGLWAWVKTAAADLGPSHGVTINIACPGPHATDRMRQLAGPEADTTQMGDPADFGRVVAFLCSAAAGFVNGAAIVVDGGLTLAL